MPERTGGGASMACWVCCMLPVPCVGGRRPFGILLVYRSYAQPLRRKLTASKPTSSGVPVAVLTFELPDGSTRDVDVRQVLNAGYAGRRQQDVAAHVAELAE